MNGLDFWTHLWGFISPSDPTGRYLEYTVSSLFSLYDYLNPCKNHDKLVIQF